MGTMVRKEIYSRFQIHIICMGKKKKKIAKETYETYADPKLLLHISNDADQYINPNHSNSLTLS